MGVICPPWISKRWFLSCPFNYCDHFGDKKVLGKLCKICRAELDEGVPSEYFYNISLLTYDPWEENTSLIPDDPCLILGNDEPLRRDIPVYIMAQKYGNHIEAVIQNLQHIPNNSDVKLVNKAIDILSHSRHFIIVKLARAIESRYEEQLDDDMRDLADSKTASFFAYIAIQRNARALLVLSRHKPLQKRRRYYLKLAAVSIEICEMIQKEFFPNDKLIYKEIGCDYFKE